MKNQLFSKLKQEYSYLGLGDDFLQAQSNSLASLGFVTEENIESVVQSQKAFLEDVQKSNDKRVTAAVKKANESAASKAVELEKQSKARQEELQKQLDDALKKLDEKNTPPVTTKKTEEDDFQTKFAAANAQNAEELKSIRELVEKLQSENKAQKADLTKLQNEKEAMERKQAIAERQAKIIAKAKELQIPQYRIDEGFNISETATDEEIGTYLTTVAGNIKTNSLPTNSHFAMAGKEPSKAEADSIANMIVR